MTCFQPHMVEAGDLGFSFALRKNGDVQISRQGCPVVILKGAKARTFASRASAASAPEAQQLMARVTGQYKRGNERLAGDVPKRAAPDKD